MWVTAVSDQPPQPSWSRTRRLATIFILGDRPLFVMGHGLVIQANAALPLPEIRPREELWAGYPFMVISW